MKKKYIVFIALGVILVGLVVSVCINNLHKIDERIFGIDAGSYEVVEEKNTLHPFSYNGSYSIIINVNEDELETFLSELDNRFCSEKEMESNSYSEVLERKYDIQIDENWLVYIYMGTPKWKAISLLEPKTQVYYVAVSPLEDGVYKVYLYY